MTLSDYKENLRDTLKSKGFWMMNFLLLPGIVMWCLYFKSFTYIILCVVLFFILSIGRKDTFAKSIQNNVILNLAGFVLFYSVTLTAYFSFPEISKMIIAVLVVILAVFIGIYTERLKKHFEETNV